MKHLYVHVKRFNFKARLIIHDDVDSFKKRIKKRCMQLIRGSYIPINQNRHEIYNNFSLLTPLGLNYKEHFQLPSLAQPLIEVCKKNIEQKSHIDNYIALQLGAANSTTDPKLWLLDRWETLIHSLLKRNEKVVMIGGKNEAVLGDAIKKNINDPNLHSLIGQTSIHEMLGVIINARGVIGADSGVAHMAAVLSKPTIVLWGPSAFQKSHPIGPRVFYVNKHKTCAPCYGPSFYGLLDPQEVLKACPINSSLYAGHHCR